MIRKNFEIQFSKAKKPKRTRNFGVYLQTAWNAKKRTTDKKIQEATGGSSIIELRDNDIRDVSLIKNENVTQQRNLSNHFKVWKFGTINIRTGDEKSEGAKMYIIAKEMDKAGLTFCCLQEVRHRGKNKKVIELNNGNQFVFMWCGKKKKEKRKSKRQ